MYIYIYVHIYICIYMSRVQGFRGGDSEVLLCQQGKHGPFFEAEHLQNGRRVLRRPGDGLASFLEQQLPAGQELGMVRGAHVDEVHVGHDLLGGTALEHLDASADHLAQVHCDVGDEHGVALALKHHVHGGLAARAHAARREQAPGLVAQRHEGGGVHYAGVKQSRPSFWPEDNTIT